MLPLQSSLLLYFVLDVFSLFPSDIAKLPVVTKIINMLLMFDLASLAFFGYGECGVFQTGLLFGCWCVTVNPVFFSCCNLDKRVLIISGFIPGHINTYHCMCFSLSN